MPCPKPAPRITWRTWASAAGAAAVSTARAPVNDKRVRRIGSLQRLYRPKVAGLEDRAGYLHPGYDAPKGIRRVRGVPRGRGRAARLRHPGRGDARPERVAVALLDR